MLVALSALVASDLWVGAVDRWWDRHSLIASVVTTLLGLAVAGLIVDEVVARRRRRERATTVAVQGLIVFGQARRAWESLRARRVDGPSGPQPPGTDSNGADPSEEWRALAGMLLSASPSLFDDPEARRFLEAIERLSGAAVHSVLTSRGGGSTVEDRQQLVTLWADVESAVQPLLARIPGDDRSLLEGPP